ncbi:MAG TPA: LacI family DNA-binding transcriptional regulator [Chloroflexota bacterium]|nr:LacI family DNA-binding transcriptional regulator [Chloroflexota bacterium]
MRLRDLATQAGVHPSTVSRVLNGDPSVRVSEETRAKLLRLAAATGYRPNRLARSLKMQRTRIVGMLVPDVTNPFFAVLLRAVEDAASEAGYNVILCNTDDSPARLETHLRVLSEGHVDGLLLATAHRRDPAVESLRRRRLPYVLVNRRRDDPDDSSVVPDDRLGAQLAVEHLVALGHRRIAHIAAAPDISTSALRLEGFRVALAAHGRPAVPELVVEGALTEAGGERAMRRLLALPPGRCPTAVFAVNDLAALGAIAAAQDAGRRVPEDVSVVGYNDLPSLGRARPPLTSVRVPLYEMGRRAVHLLIGMLGRVGAAEPAHVVLPVELVVRASTAPPKESP